MAGAGNKKRANDAKAHRPSKKQKRRQILDYHSESEAEDEDGQEFDAVNLLDSDDDIHNATVDDAAAVGDDESSSSDEERPSSRKSKTVKPRPSARQMPNAGAEEEEEEDEDDDDAGEDDSDLEEDGAEDQVTGKKPKSKRNDPNAFATSLSKILSTKLSSSKRSDPVLSRSAAAHEASKAAVDTALESKAKRQMREQKRQAMEKGRVKDVLVATRNEATGEAEVSTTEILETERRLRKVAQRGVVKLFNAVRAAQVKATETERGNKKEGVIGTQNRSEKVNELSKKGFLDLIASGGGSLKKGALEEA